VAVPTDLLRDLLEARSAVLADLQAAPGGGDRLLVRSDLAGTMQVYEWASGELRQVTGLPEPVGGAHYLAGSRRAVLEIDSGGDERHQLYLVDLDVPAPLTSIGQLAALTDDPKHGHHFAGTTRDGQLLAYVSNRRNGVDFDLWVYDLQNSIHRCLYADGGWCQPASGFSPDGRWVSVLRPGPRPLDTDLLLVEVATGNVRVVLPHGDEASEVGQPAWVDASTFYVSSNVGSDFAAVVECRVDGDEVERLPGTGRDWDAIPVTDPRGRTLLVVENAGGESVLRLTEAGGGSPLREVPLPEPGVVVSHVLPPPKLSADGVRVYYTLSTPRLAGDVWCFDARTGSTNRITESPSRAPAEMLASPDLAFAESFDGLHIPLFAYRPSTNLLSAGAEGCPVVVVVHGGPEGQSVRSFMPIIQGLVAAGFGVVVPNVRGSTGYGKRYSSLDDTVRRLDSVRDLAAVHGWLAGAGFDPGRAALWGGSYGGYMVLAGLAFQPELWAAGVDIVGISDLITFLENTSDYRRAHREREYGSLSHDREFLASASPLRRADRIRAPLFVIHGRNDPRVPVSEAEQLVARLEGRGIRCELVIYPDEGHGLARLANRLDAYPRAVAFLDEVLRPTG
jgi:dipeptidyl aminopeptidase/acylaminoacyl peptidase